MFIFSDNYGFYYGHIPLLVPFADRSVNALQEMNVLLPSRRLA